MATNIASEKQGKYTFEDLMWEHSVFNENLNRCLHRTLKTLLKKASEEHFESTNKIILNAIGIFSSKLNICPEKIYFDRRSFEFSMVLVFNTEVMRAKEYEIYDLMTEIQRQSIKFENMDFKWHILDESYIDEDFILEEFPTTLAVTLNNAE